jgi:hypothetical protein
MMLPITFIFQPIKIPKRKVEKEEVRRMLGKEREQARLKVLNVLPL